MKYLFLNEKFYLEYNDIDFPEIERKSERPYIMIQININNIDFAVPLRSGIAHNNVFWTDKPNKCGVDYSKAVIIPDLTYIDNRQPYIRPLEHSRLKGREYLLKTGLEKYIIKYKDALFNIHIYRNAMLCKFSTLQYYHKEIGL